MQKQFIRLFLLAIIGSFSNAFNVISINLLIKKSVQDSLISFIKLPNIYNLKIKNHSSYLILKYLDEPPKKPIDLIENEFKNELIKVNDMNNEVMNVVIDKMKFNYEVIDNNNYKNDDSLLNVYDIIKTNVKPLIIINKSNKNNMNHKYLYLIKSKNEYLVRYTFDYNKKKYKYYFDITASPIDKYETSWEISALIADYSISKSLTMIGFYVKNWIENNIYNNIDKNSFYKRYLVLYYFLNS